MNIHKSRQPSLPSAYYVRTLFQLIAITPEVCEASQLTSRQLFPGRKPEARSGDLEPRCRLCLPCSPEICDRGPD